MNHPAHPTLEQVRDDLRMQVELLKTKAADLAADIERVAGAVRDDYGQGSERVARDLDAAAKRVEQAYEDIDIAFDPEAGA